MNDTKFDSINCRRHIGGYNPAAPAPKSPGQKLTDILRNRRLKIGRSKNGSISDSLNFNSEASNASANRNSHSGVTRNNSVNSYQSGRSYRSIKSNGTALTTLSSLSGSSASKSSKGKLFLHNSKYEDDVSDGQLGINEKELNSMNKHIPALKSYGKSATFRQHYYPEGGWGWVIVFCCFLVELFTTGLQLSFGVLYLEIIFYTGEEYTMAATWVGSTNLSLSFFLTPFIVAVCRRKSTRLIAIIGGLVLSLSILFASFADEFHQIFLSYGIMCGIGCAMVRETAVLMLSQYFKRKRELVEMLADSGSGIGIVIFSNVYSAGISFYGWRFGLQVISLTLSSLFFMGLFYRSATLYHPQRRAILHLKDMSKRKGKDKNKVESKPPYFDFGTLKIHSFRVMLLSTAFTSMGVYSPLFYFVPMARKEGLEDNVILLQTFLGLGVSLGIFGFGFVVLSKNSQCIISKKYLVQASIFGVALSILALTSVEGYHGYLLFTWMYGIFLGGYLYSLKVFTFERLKVKHFNRGWGFIKGVQSLPVLAGIPISAYVNAALTGNPKIGFYFSLGTSILGGLILFCAVDGSSGNQGLYYSTSKQDLMKTDTNLTLELLPHGSGHRRSREFIRSASGGIAGFTSSEMHSSASSSGPRGVTPEEPHSQDLRRCTCGDEEGIQDNNEDEVEEDDEDEEEEEDIFEEEEDEEDIVVEKDHLTYHISNPDSLNEIIGEEEKEEVEEEEEEEAFLSSKLGKRKLTCISEENLNEGDVTLEENNSAVLPRCYSEPDLISFQEAKLNMLQRRQTWHRY